MALIPRSQPWPPGAGSRDLDPAAARPGLTVFDSGAGLDDLLDEFTGRWERGEAPRAEEFLGRLGPGAQGDAVGLVYHEFCLAESSGHHPDPSAYLLRFPAQRDRLARLFGLHEALGGPAAPPALPEAGDEVGPFRLLRELGRGGMARVFLAEQEDLDDRLVVVKVAGRASAEPRLLARARHPHIVEVLRHDRTADGALHLICMPFLGGATLAAVLAEGRRGGAPPRSGRDFLAILDRVSDPAYPPGLGRPAREVLAGSSRARAVAWIVARLAEALDHAHGRGVAHGDLKPANILLTADGQPMLLDFNLAVDWGRADPADLAGDGGGTLAYMAPERLRAVADPARAPAPRSADRHRADIYALGLVLRELLGGPAPAAPPPVAGRSPRELAAVLAEARRRGPSLAGVPGALRPILARCLAPDPADRYARAAELAEDLDRWRADLPPAYAAARGWGLGRWARRRRAALLAGALCVATGALATLGACQLHRGTLREQALAKLGDLWSHKEPGVYRYRVGWQVKSEGDPAELAARLLAKYDVLGPADWRDRTDVRHLPVADRADLEGWMMEQAWRLAAALRDRPDSPADWRRALAALDRVSALTSLPPIEAERRALRARLGQPEPPPPDRPPPAAPRWMEDYLRGVEAESLQARAALGDYRDALHARPGAYWAHYRAAVVACRLGDYDLAAEHLDHCLRRRPDNPALRAQKAACLQTAKRWGDALVECESALKLDPDFWEAYRDRLFIRADLGQTEAMQADLARCDVLANGLGSGFSRTLRLDLRDLLGWSPPPGERDDGLGRALDADPDDHRVRYELVRRLDNAGRAEDALAQCDAILAVDRDHLRARFYRATLLMKRGRGGAIPEFAAIVRHPRFEEFLRGNAVAIRAYHYLSRDHLDRGEVGQALDVARRGLAQAERFQMMRGESHYCLARAYAAAARSDPAMIRPAAEHLNHASAIYADYLDSWFAGDPGFEGLRPNILALVATLRSRPDLITPPR